MNTIELNKQKYQDLHKRYNQIFFDGQLPEAVILTKEEAISIDPNEPLFSNDAIRGVYMYSEKAQIDNIVLSPPSVFYEPLELTLLHEMIHQYCIYNKLIEDDAHGDLFIEAARMHGLVESSPWNAECEEFDGSRYNDFLKCGVDLDTFRVIYVHYTPQNIKEYHGNIDWTKFIPMGDTAL